MPAPACTRARVTSLTTAAVAATLLLCYIMCTVSTNSARTRSLSPVFFGGATRSLEVFMSLLTVAALSRGFHVVTKSCCYMFEENKPLAWACCFVSRPLGAFMSLLIVAVTYLKKTKPLAWACCSVSRPCRIWTPTRVEDLRMVTDKQTNERTNERTHGA